MGTIVRRIEPKRIRAIGVFREDLIRSFLLTMAFLVRRRRPAVSGSPCGLARNDAVK
jgi:hypothetical protein